MEIRNNPIENRARLETDITRLNREAIEATAERVVTEKREADRVEVSERVKEAAEQHDTDRAERVRELRAERDRGELNSDERIQRAADQMLAGE
jgi:hypothetical protein